MAPLRPTRDEMHVFLYLHLCTHLLQDYFDFLATTDQRISVEPSPKINHRIQ